MRHLIAQRGLEDEIEVASAGTGGWHIGDPPDARSTEAARKRGITLRRCGAAGHGRGLRAVRPAHRDGPPEPARPARDRPRRGGPGPGAPAARVRPGQRRGPRPRRAGSVLRRPARVRRRARSRRGRLLPACSIALLPERIAGRTVVSPTTGAPAATSTTRSAARWTTVTTVFVKTRAGRARRASGGARRTAWPGSPSPGRSRCPRSSGSGRRGSRSSGSTHGGAPDPEALGRGLALLHRAGAECFGAPWTYGFGAVDPVQRAAPATGPTFYAQRRLLPLARLAADRGALPPRVRSARRARLRANARPDPRRGAGAAARRSVERQRHGRRGTEPPGWSIPRRTAAIARWTSRCSRCSARPDDGASRPMTRSGRARTATKTASSSSSCCRCSSTPCCSAAPTVACGEHREEVRDLNPYLRDRT